MYRITALARKFGLSRSTLLYYDRIGLLQPAGRSEAGYRLYSKGDVERLKTVCEYKQAGLAIDDIRRMLEKPQEGSGIAIKQRLDELGRQIRSLQSKQRMLAEMLAAVTDGYAPLVIDKYAWMEMFRSAGMDEAAMCRWHREFEQRAPQAHQEFLESLGITAEESEQVRSRATECCKSHNECSACPQVLK